MEELFKIDWASLFKLDTSIPEIFIRGTLIYLALFVVMRFILKREAGAISITDLLVVAMIADAAQNGMSGDYQSIPAGILLVLTIIFWSYTLDWLAYRLPGFGKLVHPPPLLLVKNGHMIRRNMRKEFLTEEELMSLLREQGINDLAQAAEVNMEGDGRVSVVTTEMAQNKSSRSKAK